jgi:ATP-dependent Clp protease ATP-binding subunit ClpA/ATP-dependent Clp protease ATP-binding subunit ClpC
MRRDLSITVFERKVEGHLRWYPLVPWPGGASFAGKSEVRLREEMTRAAREYLRSLSPGEQELWDAIPGTRLHHVHLDLSVKSTAPVRVSGRFPFVVEPRWFTESAQRLCAFHPLTRETWFDAADLAEVEELAPHFARRAWNGLTEGDIETRRHTGKERLLTVSFRVEPQTLLDKIRSAKHDRTRAGLGRSVVRVLSRLGVDQTARAIDGTLPLGVPREGYRAQLQRVLGGKPRSTLLVGRPGSGRSTLLSRWVADRLEEDGWYIERNTDRIHHVWRLSGKRLVAGMMYMGDWEARLLQVVEEAREYKGVLWFDDLHLFGRLGVTRQSERSFADFFRGPIQRGDVAVIGTITREQLARLEDDAPSFAGLFTRIAVEPTTSRETAKLALAEVRRLESERPVELHPFLPRTVIELAGSLFPWTAMPGAAIELLRKLVVSRGPADPVTGSTDRPVLEPADAVALAARETGLPEHLIRLDAPLDPVAVEAHFAARVIGQEEATATATELVLKVRAGLVDAARPLGVYLFTGPTGTGKTELATAMAEYLYGDARRLLRFDMSELSGGDAVARLIGDRWSPEGLLTQKIREQPFSVVLLDEIEKAHPSVLALLLQMFDEGRLTDAAGDVASFRHAAIVMTSNLGARAAAPIGFGDGTSAVMGEIAKAVREFFPPELWNRIDRIVPFKPLTPEVAAKVVDKELAKLMARRGLRERNVFVYAGRALRERAVAQAFDPRYGARTVKRWLEDQVASSLAEALSTAPPARLTVARLRDEGGNVAVDLEQLPEAKPLPGDFPLAAWRELSAAALAPHTEEMAHTIDDVLDGGEIERQLELARTSARGDEVRYFVEEYRETLGKLRVSLAGERKVTRPTRRKVEDSDDDVVHDLEAIPHESHVRRYDGSTFQTRRFDRRSIDGRRHRMMEQGAALVALARSRLFVDHVGALATPESHAVTVRFSSMGPRRHEGWDAIVSLLLERYSNVEELASVDKHGKLHGAEARTYEQTSVHLTGVIREVLAGPALAAEHGSHVFQSIAGEPEIVRVAVMPGAVDVKASALAHRDAMAAFDAAVAAGGAAPPNPEPLLPVVRAISYTPPRRVGEPLVAEVEDFVTGFAARVTAPTLADVILHCWHVRWSRHG